MLYSSASNSSGQRQKRRFECKCIDDGGIGKQSSSEDEEEFLASSAAHAAN